MGGGEFAQVEFVAALTVVFGRYLVKLARVNGENEGDARQRAQKALRESSAFLALTMKDDVPLCLRRGRPFYFLF